MGCENMSRYEKYRSVREGIKDLNAKNKQVSALAFQEQGEDDDFLDFLKQPGHAVSRVEHFEDTLEVAKTFEEIKSEPNPEIDRAIKSAKQSLGGHDDTRLSILNKIKNPQVEAVAIDRDDKYLTQDFKQGMFINGAEDENQDEAKSGAADDRPSDQGSQTKRPKSLLERLEEMSPKDPKTQSAPKVKAKEPGEVEVKGEKPAFKMEDTSPFEGVSPEKTIIVSKNELDEPEIHDEIGENSKGALILNAIIVILILIFVVLCGYIATQIL